MSDADTSAEVTIVNAVRAQPPVVPTGPLSLCASLEARGVAVRFEDYQAYDGDGLGDPDAFARWLAAAAPILGFSVLSSSLPLVLAAARRLARDRPDRRLVLGGPATAGVEELLLRRFPEFDAVVHGEGEETLAELVEAYRGRRPLASVPGISFRDGLEVRSTPPRPRNVALHRLPPPAYHLANLAFYRDDRFLERTPFGVVLARGCAFTCAFCAIPNTWGSVVASRDVDAVVDEVRELRDRFGVDSFRLLDDTFTLDRRRALHFCERLAAAALDMPWLCHARVDLVDETLLGAMREAGCRLIFFGIESGSDRVLERLGKTFGVARALDAVELARRYMDVETSFMWGFPFETLDDLFDTLVVVLAAHEMGARTKLSWFVPFPATALVRDFGALLSRTLRHEVFPTRSHMDAYEYGPELMAIATANPDLFPNFRYLDSPGHDAKMEYLKRWTGNRGGAGQPGSPPVASPRPRQPDMSRLPGIAPGVTVRVVGGRRFAFDAERLRAFRITEFGAGVLEACRQRANLDTLLTCAVAHHLRSHVEIRAAVERAVALLEAAGLVIAWPDRAGDAAVGEQSPAESAPVRSP